jgi:hypothetical protein
MLPDLVEHTLAWQKRKTLSNLLFNILGVAQCLKLAVEMKTVSLFPILQSADTAINVILSAKRNRNRYILYDDTYCMMFNNID